MRLIRDREKGGKGVWRWREREIVYLSLHCHHQNDFCIKVGSNENHFNVSVGSDGQSRKTVSTDHNFWRERSAKADLNRGPSAYQPNALPLGQTGSHCAVWLQYTLDLAALFNFFPGGNLAALFNLFLRGNLAAVFNFFPRGSLFNIIWESASIHFLIYIHINIWQMWQLIS